MGRMINSRNLSAYLYALMFAVPGAQINQTMTNTLFALTNSNSNNNHNKSSPSNGEREMEMLRAELSSTWSLKTCGAFASEKARTCCHLGPQVPMPPSHTPLVRLRRHQVADIISEQSRFGIRQSAELKSLFRFHLDIVISFVVRSNVSRSRYEYYTCRYIQHDAIITLNAKIKHKIRIRNKNNNYSTLNGQQVFKRIEHYINSCAFSTISLRIPKWLSVICVLRRYVFLLFSYSNSSMNQPKIHLVPKGRL